MYLTYYMDTDKENPPVESDTNTPPHEQRIERIENERVATPNDSTAESRTQPDLQIEGHNLFNEDHESKAHILYNLSGLDSLPRRSSSSISYLNASQKKLRRSSLNPKMQGEMEILSRIRSTEERIANVPIRLQNMFQILQRGDIRQVGSTSGAKSL